MSESDSFDDILNDREALLARVRVDPEPMVQELRRDLWSRWHRSVADGEPNEFLHQLAIEVSKIAADRAMLFVEDPTEPDDTGVSDDTGGEW
jgi:hypothetical protein